MAKNQSVDVRSDHGEREFSMRDLSPAEAVVYVVDTV
ncbi:hypothetical protein SNOG_07931 [Parastagonospora nodorum SN15]|uniref:Uncharacterized protein n=1 Tax=Phaeosphaeria nodorum (strain SN15 / ATCC MYA-4574 / FGSC 10173) TaxID=321614 RepID=Q0UJY3_PHANO|nr:hypothetical protein SNOG_07931 [Parastagonospora nodorum SN15]EAT84207.1 hypothetical protein SNOG_07931 [Parastagonospora nodorum SN15]